VSDYRSLRKSSTSFAVGSLPNISLRSFSTSFTKSGSILVQLDRPFFSVSFKYFSTSYGVGFLPSFFLSYATESFTCYWLTGVKGRGGGTSGDYLTFLAGVTAFYSLRYFSTSSVVGALLSLALSVLCALSTTC